MKRIILVLFLLPVTSLISYGQTTLKPGKYEMSYILNGKDVAVVEVNINTSNNRLAFYTVTHINNSNEVRLDTTIADATTFVPVYRSSINKKYELKLQYGQEITGYYLDKQTGKKIVIKDHVTGPFIDDNCFQYFLTTLPLTTGYKKNVNLYDYKPTNSSNIKKLLVEEVKSDSYAGTLSGDHKV